MLPENDADVRQQNMLHGLFHRIQPELGLITDDGHNEHLDTLEGRFWIQLEWRALRRALESSGSDRPRRSPMRWLSDANAAACFPARRTTNDATRFAKGLPPTPASRPGPTRPRMPAVPQRQRSSRRGAWSFVGNFEAASGPAYGVLLDDLMPEWRRQLRSTSDLGDVLASATDRPPTTDVAVAARATTAQRCGRRRRRAIGRSRSASPSCVNASLMGPC
jgi:hypothetical protein